MRRRLAAVLMSGWAKVVLFLACLVPLADLLWRGYHQDLSLNPVNFVEHATGDWVLRFLVMTLAITPLRKILGLPELIRFRRMLGLFAFFYVCLHFSTWVGVDRYWDSRAMLEDIGKRPFITVGFTGFLLLIPLAITSTAGWIRRLGGKRWQLLHRAIYLTAICGVIHYYWLVKSDVRKPLEYAFLVGVLLAWRLWAWFSGSRKAVPTHISREPDSPVTAETMRDGPASSGRTHARLRSLPGRVGAEGPEGSRLPLKGHTAGYPL
ncbi:MAG TPA: protein-methionine-sulfoxide reductase heme-binding subunit MsrQ [Candidatus Cybelea sp.]|nr:protein-methionine-sulfoxide reductase heme-binding subunit MsrQ [Candidatus Cybelea sp.]